ncbi:MAG: Uma2 family endonuclease [Pseudanabaenaceae cyanobacterium bins.68]|nr:Uma2 family endonuclease [Pseudanabaenaceae cyanobacterium bins.68]
MVAIAPISSTSPTLISEPTLPKVTWHKLPEDFILPEDPLDNNLQPLLAEALRESLELAELFLESMLIATNFGICATVADKTVVKAPDWVYIPEVKPLSGGVIRHSYTPNVEGDRPLIALEFISETEGTEYSINPHYPYGKWYFYERISQVPLYGIFHPTTGTLDLFRLVEGRYESQSADQNNRFWIAEMNLFLGTWAGKRSQVSTTWLRWWDSTGNLLPWGSEKIAQEKLIAEQERQRAEVAEAQLQQERAIRQRLSDRLTALGIDIDTDEE